MRLGRALLFGCVCLGLSVPVFTSDFQNNQFISKSYAGELSAKDIKAAESFVTNVADEGIEFLSDQRFTHEQRVKEFKELLSNNFDMRTIARFSLGRYWRTATDAQKKEYLRLFKENILEIYSRRFSDYKDQKVEVRSARKEGKADVLVSSYVVSPDAPEVKVDWRVRQKNGQYKIIDIIVEGVSQALTHRSDYSSVIQRGGGDVEVLLAHLRK